MNYDHVYTWGNNEKRKLLKNKRCAILARGKKGSIMVEFEDGTQEITSHYAVRKGETNMAERRSYRPAATEKPVREVKEVAEKAPETEKPQEEKRDSKFVNVTGLFRSRSGKADTVFVTEAIYEHLQKIQVNDVLGVSENSNNGNLQLWYIPGEAN